jgi:hypothetical protein
MEGGAEQFSCTPVQGGWLAGPLEVQASFTDARGRTLSKTHLTLSPR